MAAIIFLNFDAMPIIRLLNMIISDVAANYYFSDDFNKILHGNLLEDGEYNGDYYFSKFLYDAFNEAINRNN